jgi:transcriptional regulator with XRE-family HTH domain
VNGITPLEGRVTFRLSPLFFELTKGWSLKRLAEAAGIHRSNMQRVMAGEQFPSRNAITGIVRMCRREFPAVDPLLLFEIVPDEPSELLRRAA